MSEFIEDHLIKIEIDHATTGSDGVAVSTTATHPLGVYIPKNAVVTSVWYDVIETFASTSGGTDKATIALKIEGTGDIVAALAIEAGTNIWDAGIHSTIVGSPTLSAFDAANSPTALEYASTKTSTPALTMIKTTVIREVTVTVATAALTAGKMNLFIEYVLSS